MEVSEGMIAAVAPDKAITTTERQEGVCYVCFPVGNFLFDCLKMRQLYHDTLCTKQDGDIRG